MEIDPIIEIGIDQQERLYIKPKTARFDLIYRTATEVHWDAKALFLFSPKPREWSYLKWYIHIINVAEVECSYQLIITKQTTWVGIPDQLKQEILNLV